MKHGFRGNDPGEGQRQQRRQRHGGFLQRTPHPGADRQTINDERAASRSIQLGQAIPDAGDEQDGRQTYGQSTGSEQLAGLACKRYQGLHVSHPPAGSFKPVCADRR